MSDTDGKKPLGLGGAPRSGQVKQSFSHGRTKSGVVQHQRDIGLKRPAFGQLEYPSQQEGGNRLRGDALRLGFG